MGIASFVRYVIVLAVAMVMTVSVVFNGYVSGSSQPPWEPITDTTTPTPTETTTTPPPTGTPTTVTVTVTTTVGTATVTRTVTSTTTATRTVTSTVTRTATETYIGTVTVTDTAVSVLPVTVTTTTTRTATVDRTVTATRTVTSTEVVGVPHTVTFTEIVRVPVPETGELVVSDIYTHGFGSAARNYTVYVDGQFYTFRFDNVVAGSMGWARVVERLGGDPRAQRHIANLTPTFCGDRLITIVAGVGTWAGRTAAIFNVYVNNNFISMWVLYDTDWAWEGSLRRARIFVNCDGYISLAYSSGYDIRADLLFDPTYTSSMIRVDVYGYVPSSISSSITVWRGNDLVVSIPSITDFSFDSVSCVWRARRLHVYDYYGMYWSFYLAYDAYGRFFVYVYLTRSFTETRTVTATVFREFLGTVTRTVTETVGTVTVINTSTVTETVTETAYHIDVVYEFIVVPYTVTTTVANITVTSTIYTPLIIRVTATEPLPIPVTYERTVTEYTGVPLFYGVRPLDIVLIVMILIALVVGLYLAFRR